MADIDVRQFLTTPALSHYITVTDRRDGWHVSVWLAGPSAAASLRPTLLASTVVPPSRLPGGAPWAQVFRETGIALGELGDGKDVTWYSR